MKGGICASTMVAFWEGSSVVSSGFSRTLQSGDFSFFTYLNNDDYLLMSSTPGFWLFSVTFRLY